MDPIQSDNSKFIAFNWYMAQKFSLISAFIEAIKYSGSDILRRGFLNNSRATHISELKDKENFVEVYLFDYLSAERTTIQMFDTPIVPLESRGALYSINPMNEDLASFLYQVLATSSFR